MPVSCWAWLLFLPPLSVASAVSFSPRVTWSSWQHTVQSFPSSLLCSHPPATTHQPHPPHPSMQTGAAVADHMPSSWVKKKPRSFILLRNFEVSIIICSIFPRIFQGISRVTSIKNKRCNKKITSQEITEKTAGLFLLETESMRIWFHDLSHMKLKCTLRLHHRM